MNLQTYAIGLLASLVLGLILGWKIESWRAGSRYEALQASYAESSAKALKDAESRSQAITASYEAKLRENLDGYQKDVATVRANADFLASSLHDYEIRLRSCALSQGAKPSSGTNGSSPVHSSDAGIADATRRVLEVCSSDAAQLKALQAERLSIAQ